MESLLPAVFAASTCAAHAQDQIATSSSFSLASTFTTSTPAVPIAIGGRDLVINHYIATTVNPAGEDFLSLTAGHCTNPLDRGGSTVAKSVSRG